MNMAVLRHRIKYFTLFFIVVAFGISMAGCASSPKVENAGTVITTEHAGDGRPVKTVEQRTDYAAYLKTFETANATPASAKIVEFDCGAGECSFRGKMTVYAPPTGAAPRAIPLPPPVIESESWKVWREFKETAIGVAGLVAPWHYGSRILTTALQRAPTSTVNTTTVNATGSGSAASAGGNASGGFASTATSTTNTATTTTTNSNNTTRTCTTGSGGSGGTATTTGGAGAPSGAANC